MSKDTALQFAQTTNPQAPEPKVSLIGGEVPSNVKEMTNPQVNEVKEVPSRDMELQKIYAKKEAKLLEEREQIKKLESELKEKLARSEEFYKKAASFEETRKSDPIKALKEIGFTEQEIVDFLSREDEINAVPPEQRAREAAQEEIKKWKEEQEKAKLEAQRQADEVQIKRFQAQIHDAIETNKEKFELTHYHGSQAEEIAFGIALEEANSGVVPVIESIIEDVEAYFEEEQKQISQLKKFQPKEAPLEEMKKEPERTRTVHPPQDVTEPTRPKATTLTNRIAATTAGVASKEIRTETHSEKKERLKEIIRKHGLTR